MVKEGKGMGSLRVNAFDSEDNKKIFANTIIEGGGNTYSDYVAIPAGIYDLTVDYPGYISNIATVSINANTTTPFNIDLVPDNLTLD